jgi:hypothetical protein
MDAVLSWTLSFRQLMFGGADLLSDDADSVAECRGGVHLPDEILVEIFEWLSASNAQSAKQSLVATAVRLNRSWFKVGIRYLYVKPQIHGRKYDRFIRTVCSPRPRSKLHTPSQNFGSFVKDLDLRSLTYQGSNSTTARLIGRCKDNLEVFRAPAVHFGISALNALALCKKLRILDLSFTAAEVDWHYFQTLLKKLPFLEAIDFPGRRNREAVESEPFYLPPSLARIRITSVKYDDPLLAQLTSGELTYGSEAPAHQVQSTGPLLLGLTTLLLQDGCLERPQLVETLRYLGSQLREFGISGIDVPHGLDDIFELCPKLLALHLPSSSFTDLLLEKYHAPPDGHLDSWAGNPEHKSPHPLQFLELLAPLPIEALFSISASVLCCIITGPAIFKRLCHLKVRNHWYDELSKEARRALQNWSKDVGRCQKEDIFAARDAGLTIVKGVGEGMEDCDTFWVLE